MERESCKLIHKEKRQGRMSKLRLGLEKGIVWIGDRLEGSSDRLASQTLSSSSSDTYIKAISRRNSSNIPQMSDEELLSKLEERRNKYRTSRDLPKESSNL